MNALALVLLSFLCSVQALYVLKFDPNIDGKNIPIDEPLTMSVVSDDPQASGQVQARIIYDISGEDENIIFTIGESRIIKFKAGLVGSTKLVADQYPVDCQKPAPMKFALVTQATFKGISKVMLINNGNFIYIKANVRPIIVDSATVYLLCDDQGNQQYVTVQQWDNVPLNVNYPIVVDGSAVAEGQVCQLTTGISNDYVTDALSIVEMTYGKNPFGQVLVQLTKQQGENHAKTMHLHNSDKITSEVALRSEENTNTNGMIAPIGAE